VGSLGEAGFNERRPADERGTAEGRPTYSDVAHVEPVEFRTGQVQVSARPEHLGLRGLEVAVEDRLGGAANLGLLVSLDRRHA
jgi:hypothetical protein